MVSLQEEYFVIKELEKNKDKITTNNVYALKTDL